MAREDIEELSSEQLMTQWNAARNAVHELKRDCKELNAAKKEAIEREEELAAEISARHELAKAASRA
jgi:hypothetical protein